MVVNNEQNTLDVEKALRQLKSSYDMYEKTKKETEKRMKEMEVKIKNTQKLL